MSVQTSDLKTAVGQALTLLAQKQYDLADQQAQEILRLFPDELNSQYVVAAVNRVEGKLDAAVDQLSHIIAAAPDFARAHQELGFCHSDSGHLLEAITSLQTAISIEPKLPESWRALGELFFADEDEDSSREAFNQYLILTSHDSEIVEAVQLFKSGKIGQAEQACRVYLKQHPTDVTAIRLLADIGIQVGVYEDAENLLSRALQLAPDFTLARLNYANVLSKREKLDQALAQVQLLLEAEPDKFPLLVLRASILVKLGAFDKALRAYEYLLKNFPPRAHITLGYGHALKTVGEQSKAIDSYRKSIELRPGFGDAYWSLANLKMFRFEEAEIEAMRAQINANSGNQEDYFHLCFALGKALEDREEYEESFRFYEIGNKIKFQLEAYNADITSGQVTSIKQSCDLSMFESASTRGLAAADPIFIIGLPRSGSTLLEQILASHSQVDGTKELMDMLSIARRLGGKKKKSEISAYPQILSELHDDQLKDLGQEYLDRTQIQRGDAPFFIDKMPNNFMHVGLISLILPNAKIIDARRHPMGSCFSGFTQLFAKGQAFTYGLENIGRYYRDYMEVMDHWDLVLPGKVLLVQYEDVVADIEGQVRRLLEYCDLPFEDACINFHETERAVRTASSEQVRQPLYSGALEHWRNYEPFLDELKQHLGPVLERYPV